MQNPKIRSCLKQDYSNLDENNHFKQWLKDLLNTDLKNSKTSSCEQLINDSFLNHDQNWFGMQQDVNEILSLFIGQYSEAFNSTQSSLLNFFSFQIINYIEFKEKYKEHNRYTTTFAHK